MTGDIINPTTPTKSQKEQSKPGSDDNVNAQSSQIVGSSKLDDPARYQDAELSTNKESKAINFPQLNKDQVKRILKFFKLSCPSKFAATPAAMMDILVHSLTYMTNFKNDELKDLNSLFAIL